MRKSVIIRAAACLVLLAVLVCLSVRLADTFVRSGIWDGADASFLISPEKVPLFVLLLASAGFAAVLFLASSPKPGLHWICVVMVLVPGLMLALGKPYQTGNDRFESWDEVTHWGVVSGMTGGLKSSLQNVISWAPGYLPQILGTGLAMRLGMGISASYRVGCIASVLTYAALCGIAVKAAPRYKVTFCVIAALPVTAYMSAAMTYDVTVIGSLLLAAALLLRALDSGKRIPPARVITLCALLTLGTVAKPVYSVFLLLLWLLPEESFASKGQRAALRAYSLVLLAACFASMLLPDNAYSTVIDGDPRFADTDSRAQLAFVLSDPLHYLRVLWNYFAGNFPGLYISSLALWPYVYGSAAMNAVLALVLLLLCPLCSPDEERETPLLTPARRIVPAALTLAVLILLITAQYLVSTAVGSGNVVGMQSRYSIPMLIMLALALMLPQKLRTAVRPASRPLTAAVLTGVYALTAGYGALVMIVYLLQAVPV